MPDSHDYHIQFVGGDTWVLTTDGCTVRASDMTMRNGKIAALLIIGTPHGNLFTDVVKLTDLAERKKVVKRLQPDQVPVDEPMLRALEVAIRTSTEVGESSSASVGTTKRKAVILDDAPIVLERPLCILDDRAYAASWVYLDTGPHAALIIVREDGQVFCDSEIEGATPLTDLGITVRLPNAMNRRHCWSGRGIREYRTGLRPSPVSVFATLVALIDHHVRFVRSLGEQQEMCELLTCYILHTWLLDAFHVAGYVWFGGEKGSGKSTALKMTCQLAFAGQELTAGSSLPVLRDLSDLGALLGLDDAEQIADPKAFDGDKAALLLSGNRRGATISVKEPAPSGKGWETRDVKIFSPRVFSAIGAPPAALATRCIQIPMCKASANVPDPMDETRWPTKRRDVVDSLWALALSSIRQVQQCEGELNRHTELIGRALDPWRGVLTVAFWLDRQVGMVGLFERLTRLSQAYQREREDLEAEDPTRLAVSCLGDMLADHADPAPLIFKTADLTDRMNKRGKELDVVEDGREIKTVRVGRLLSRLRLKKPPNAPGKRRWLITQPFFDALAGAHGVNGHGPDTACVPPAAVLVGAPAADDTEEF
jgi:hypothetical protein